MFRELIPLVLADLLTGLKLWVFGRATVRTKAGGGPAVQALARNADALAESKTPVHGERAFCHPWRMYWDHEPQQIEDEHENEDKDEIKTV